MNPEKESIKKKISLKRTLERKIYILNCKKCSKEYEIKITENNFKKGRYKKYCNVKCANSHIRTEESKQRISSIIKDKIKNGEIIIKQKNENKFNIVELISPELCKNCNKKLSSQNNKSGLCKSCLSKSPEYRKKLSIINKGRTGGYREKGGRGKQGWFNGFYCNSSWELAYVIYSLDNNIKIKRNTEGFQYIFEDKIFHFYPDFIKEDGSYVEVKGYLDNKNKAKINQFQKKLEVIDRNDIKPYLNYVVNKYGTDFIKLYE